MPIVAMISSSRGLRRSLRKAFEGQSEFTLLDASSIERRTAKDLKVLQQANVVLVDLEPDHDQSIADIRSLREVGVWGEVVPISKSLDSRSMRALFELRSADWIPVVEGQLPTSREVIAACDKALQKSMELPQSSPNARCACFLAAAGGVGQTTLVAATGVLLAERRPLIRTSCLIDLDFQNSVLADYMGVEPRLDIDALGGSPERIDRTLLEIMVSRYSSGLSVLAAPRARWQTRRDLAAIVPRLLNVASELFDDIVIDLPATCMPWTADVLSGSDDIYVVTNFSVTGVRQAREIVDTLPKVADLGTGAQGDRQPRAELVVRRRPPPAGCRRCAGRLAGRFRSRSRPAGTGRHEPWQTGRADLVGRRVRQGFAQARDGAR